MNCYYCQARLTQEVWGGALVDATSGDDGGTYDYCPRSADRVHCTFPAHLQGA